MDMVRINVLKPFRFTMPPNQGHRMPVERVFGVGIHEIDEETASHPWMRAPNYADGHIETPDAAKAREDQARVKAAEAQAIAANATAQADAAMARLHRNAPRERKELDLSAEELNTPIGVLRARMNEETPEAEVTRPKKGK